MKSLTSKLAERTRVVVGTGLSSFELSNPLGSSSLVTDSSADRVAGRPEDVDTNDLLADGVDFYEIAIVGCGPKAMYSLDSLINRLGQLCRSGEHLPRIRISMFDPAKFPGAGQVYDPRQPNWLRMNFASGLIDAWKHTGGQAAGDTPVDAERLDFVGWLEAYYPALADPDGYAPRSIVGEYLFWCFTQIQRSLPEWVKLKLHVNRVIDVSRQQARWRVTSESETLVANQVLIATGHGGWRPSHVSGGIPRDDISASVNVIDKIFPVSEQLSRRRIEAGSCVAVRGFALTFIDAALTVTEGRGGNFLLTNGRLRYERSGNEPERIIPFSRTGKPMLAKPDYSKIKLPSRLRSVWLDGVSQIIDLPKAHGEVDFLKDLWPIFLRTADTALSVIGYRSKESNKAEGVAKSWFEEWTNSENSAENVLHAMKRSYAVANGQAALDPAWALAESWRQLYRPLVQRVSHCGLASKSWNCFSAIAKEMERIAFGPPAENLGRIVALVDAGIVDLRFLLGDIVVNNTRAEVALGDRSCKVDAIVDAIIPSPCHHAPDSVVGKLLTSQSLIRSPAHGGVLVDESAQVISRIGGKVDGLFVLGRAVEGCVLGNDTLSRRLHSHPEMWAERVSALISHQNIL